MRRISKDLLKPIKNSRGIMTAEFIFAMVLAAGLCIVLFGLTFTLSMAEVAQYIAFSAARAHSAAHVDQAKQSQMGKDKFNELINTTALKPLFNKPGGGWFKLESFEIRGGGQEGNFNSDYSIGRTSDRVVQVGVRFKFVTNLLNLRIPCLGRTTEDGEPLSATVTGFLLREPTHAECWNGQVKQRYSAILNLDPRYKVLGSAGQNQYVPMEDSGC
jgi:hypothetical protein